MAEKTLEGTGDSGIIDHSASQAVQDRLGEIQLHGYVRALAKEHQFHTSRAFYGDAGMVGQEVKCV